jgi:multidrug efflux pump subunit AcrA (membrane-fusion protein)
VRTLALVLVLAIGCGNRDNSADTDQATQQLQKAQTDLSGTSKAVTDNQADIERRSRDLIREQQELADKKALLEQQRQQLGSAQTALQAARTGYAAAVKARFSKLDASLATLATKTDPRSKDALVGLRARRDQLSVTLSALTGTSDLNWNEYTKTVDATFDAIEHDLDAASR